MALEIVPKGRFARFVWGWVGRAGRAGLPLWPCGDLCLPSPGNLTWPRGSRPCVPLRPAGPRTTTYGATGASWSGRGQPPPPPRPRALNRGSTDARCGREQSLAAGPCGAECDTLAAARWLNAGLNAVRGPATLSPHQTCQDWLPTRIKAAGASQSHQLLSLQPSINAFRQPEPAGTSPGDPPRRKGAGERGGEGSKVCPESAGAQGGKVRTPQQLRPGCLPASPAPASRLPHQPRPPQPGGFRSAPPPRGHVPCRGWRLCPPAGVSSFIPSWRVSLLVSPEHRGLHV